MLIGSWKRRLATVAGVAATALVVPVTVGTGMLALGEDSASAITPPMLTLSKTAVTFPDTTLGDYTVEQYTVTNSGQATATLTGYAVAGANPNDFTEGPDTTSDCPGLQPSGLVTIAGNNGTCTFDVYFFPGALGARSASLTLTNLGASVSGTTVTASGKGAIGYYQASITGQVANFGDAAFYGDLSSTPPAKPIVGIAPTGDDGGYWLVGSDGGIFSYGDAGFHGSTGNLNLNRPIVGMAATPDAAGYWLVATDGGLFAYGDAPFYGSTGNLHLNEPIVGMAPTTDGGGYWLVASDGGIFAYGDAQFFGSTGNIHLNDPIVGMAPTPDNRGYWLVAGDGGIFAYGDAQFYGSTGNLHLAQPITAMAAMPDGGGYWFTAFDGGLFNYGSAPFYGAGAGVGLRNVVAMATDGAPTPQAQTDTPAVRGPSGHSVAAGWGSPPSGARPQAGS